MQLEKGNEDNVITDIIPKAPSKEEKGESNKEEKSEKKSEETKPEVDSTVVTDPVKPAGEENHESKSEDHSQDFSKEDYEERIAKLEAERDNYKKGLLTVKSKQLKLTEDEDPIKVNEKWDENTQELQRETLEKTSDVVTRAIERMNEKSAIRRFLNKNPELVDPNIWSKVVSKYQPNRGRETVLDILEDLEETYSAIKSKHAPQSVIEKAKSDGERAGIVKARSAEMASVSGSGNHSVSKQSQTNGLSSSAKEMAMRMRTPLDKLEKEDESNTAVIQL